MSERKVLNKYFPPDFDPAKIPRRRIAKDAQQKVRLMAPFSMRCETCGDYVYKGKKFNARKELVEGEEYLGTKIFRFYIRCPKCSAEITFKTDPKNSDYVADKGAIRNFEPWRDDSADKVLAREREEEDNPMKALENRTADSKREMDILDALNEIRTKNAKMERVDGGALLDRVAAAAAPAPAAAAALAAHDDALARAIFQTPDGAPLRRLAHVPSNVWVEGPDDAYFPAGGAPGESEAGPSGPDAGKSGPKTGEGAPESESALSGTGTPGPVPPSAKPAGVVVGAMVRKRKAPSPGPAPRRAPAAPAAGLALLGGYGDASDSDGSSS